MPLVEAQDPAGPRALRPVLGLPASRVRKDLGVKAGCCSMCGGRGASGEECTGGMCWDCQGTGHPHLGPCGRWETFAAWCHRHELDALTWVLGWAWITTLLAVLPGAEPWAIYVIAVPVLLGLPTWVAMSKIGDRQVKRELYRSTGRPTRRPLTTRERYEDLYQMVEARRRGRGKGK